MMRKLERALENGFPLLIENMGETIDAVLNPVIQRALIKRGSRFYVKLGEDEVEFHENFRLFLHTKLSNPHYPPEIQAETTLVNFTVTPQGLEDQLLALVVQKEREDLASEKTALIQQQNGFKIKMKELEDDILRKLAAAEGDITEDKDADRGARGREAHLDRHHEEDRAGRKTQTQTSINNTSEKYRPVARALSLLFFLMNDLSRSTRTTSTRSTRSSSSSSAASTWCSRPGEGAKTEEEGVRRLKKRKKRIQMQALQLEHRTCWRAASDAGDFVAPNALKTNAEVRRRTRTSVAPSKVRQVLIDSDHGHRLQLRPPRAVREATSSRCRDAAHASRCSGRERRRAAQARGGRSPPRASTSSI